MTTTEAKPKRETQETWLDWMAPDKRPAKEDLITRDELLAELKDLGVEMSPVALATQERRGFLPRAVRSRRDGSPVALYPPAAADWIAYAQKMRDSGTPLRRIAPVLHAHVLLSTGHGTIDTTPGIGDVTEALEHALGLLTAWHERTHGTAVARAEACLLDATGGVLQRFAFDAARSLRRTE